MLARDVELKKEFVRFFSILLNYEETLIIHLLTYISFVEQRAMRRYNANYEMRCFYSHSFVAAKSTMN